MTDLETKVDGLTSNQSPKGAASVVMSRNFKSNQVGLGGATHGVVYEGSSHSTFSAMINGTSTLRSSAAA